MEMEKRFEVRTVLEDQAVRAYMDFQIGRRKRILFRLFRRMRWLGVVLGIVTILSVWYQQQACSVALLNVPGIWLSLSLVLGSALGQRSKVRRMRTDLLIRHRENRLIFYDDCVVVVNGQLTKTIAYEAVCRCYETERFFYFYVDEETAYILSKAGFVLGNAADFAQYMEEKTDHTVSQIQNYDLNSYTFMQIKENEVWLHKLLHPDFVNNSVTVRIWPFGVSVLYNGEKAKRHHGVYQLRDDRGRVRCVKLYRKSFSALYLNIDEDYYRISRHWSESERLTLGIGVLLFFVVLCAAAMGVLSSSVDDSLRMASGIELALLPLAAVGYFYVLRNAMLTHYGGGAKIALGVLFCFGLMGTTLCVSGATAAFGEDIQSSGWKWSTAQHAAGEGDLRVPFFLGAGIVVGEFGQLDLAEEAFGEAESLAPDVALPYYNRGIVKEKQGDLPAALAAFDHAIALYPEFAAAYLKRGLAYERMEDFGRALQNYTAAIRYDAGSAEPYFRRGIVYRRQSDNQSAVADFSEAIDLRPNNARFYEYRGAAFNALGDCGAAVADLGKAIELGARSASVYAQRGLAHGKAGEYALSVQDFTKAIQRDAKQVKYYMNRGLSYSMMEQYTDAIADFDVALSLRPNDVDIYVNRGACYDSMGETAKAIADYTKAIALDMDNVLAYYNRGVLYSSTADFAHSILDYNRVIALDPAHAKAFENRGNDYYNIGAYEEALADFNQAIVLEPRNGSFYLNRSVLYRKIGMLAAANEDFRQAVALDPQVRKGFVEKSTISESKREN